MQCWWIFDFETDYNLSLFDTMLNLETKALKLCVEKKVKQFRNKSFETTEF
jgi:hypothetical protein